MLSRKAALARHDDLFRYYEREEPDGNSANGGPGGDLSKTIDRHSGPGCVPGTSLPSESPCTALVAFRRFFTDIYHTACCGKVGQPQDIAPPSFHYIKPRFVSRDSSNARPTFGWLIELPVSCRGSYFFFFSRYPRRPSPPITRFCWNSRRF